MPKFPMPRWLDSAYRYRGLREIPGKQHNPTIVKWLRSLRAAWNEDDTPWCGTFVAEMLREHGIKLPVHWYRALAWCDYGINTSPRMGAIMVKKRKGGGHVTFYVGETATHYLGLGGNQSNCVNITPFLKSDIVAIRWPADEPNMAFAGNITDAAAADGAAGGGEA